MTAQEKETWERRRYEARLKLKEIAPVRKKLKELTKSYDRIFCFQFNKFAEADEKLAMEDGRYQRFEAKQKKKVKEDDAFALLKRMTVLQIEELKRVLSGQETK